MFRTYLVGLIGLLLMELSYPLIGLSLSESRSIVTSLSDDDSLDRISKEVEAENVLEHSYEDLSRILENNPKNYRAHLVLGSCYDLLGLPNEAYEEYKLALRYGPNDPKTYVAMINSDSKNHRITEATNLIEDGLKRFPNEPEIKYWKGNFLYYQNKVQEAESMFDEALSSKKNIFGLPSALAMIRFRQGRYREALSLANRDLIKDPKSLLANQVAGLSLVKLQRLDEAVKPLSIAFNANPLKSIFAEEYAQTLYWQGNYIKALPPALVGLALTANRRSHQFPAKEMLGKIVTHVDKANLAQAIEQISGKLGIDKSAPFHFTLGDILDKYNFKDLAIKQYKRGLELEPGFGQAWYRLGLDFETYAHDYDQALLCLRKAAVLLPEDETISKHLLRFEDRLSAYHTDWAWQLKDYLHKWGWSS